MDSCWVDATCSVFFFSSDTTSERKEDDRRDGIDENRTVMWPAAASLAGECGYGRVFEKDAGVAIVLVRSAGSTRPANVEGDYMSHEREETVGELIWGYCRKVGKCV